MESSTSDLLSLLEFPHLLLGSAAILLLLIYLTWELLQSNHVVERILLWGRPMQTLRLPKLPVDHKPIFKWVRSKARGMETAQHTQGIAMLSSTEERVSQAPWHPSHRRPSMMGSDWTCVICDHAVRESGQFKISTGKPRSQRPAVGARKDPTTEFTAANALLLEDAVVASLETHVLVKRVQHHLGLPLTLLKSLRSFMLPSPDLTLQRSRREFSVLTRPQALSFVGSGTRKKLESHLEKMVHLKRWQLPQKIQEALGQMKPPFQSAEKTPPSPARKQGPGVPSQVKYTGQMQRTSATLPTREGVLDSKTTLASQAQLQAHLVKKSLEIRLQTFPTIVGHSQKLSSRSRVLHLPKLIPLGRTCPQWRNRLSLLLRGKADIVEMNIKCKYIHFLWGLPTLYMQSLGKMAPGPPALPTASAWAHATMEFVSVEPPFVETLVLENHVLRKRLQHQWGLPGLALQSLKQFLVPVPPSPIRGPSVVRSHLEVKILTGAHPFLSTRLEMKEKLEAHMKTKIIERRWGLPRRALDSLRVFSPVTSPLSNRPKENKETFVLPQGEKGMRRKPPSRPLRTSKNLMISSAKAVQGPLAKKALEVRLGTINPMAQRSQDAARRVGKMHPLPKLILPGLRPLVPRSPELLFMGQAVLGHLQLNVIHKTLMYRWRLPTTYNKSLAQMFQDAGAARIARSPSKSTESKFIAVQTPFISRKDREVLEWHVRGKRLQHTWGLPGLVQRSLRHLLPTTLSLRPPRGRYTEVVVSLTEPTFLDNGTRRELERNVQKRIIHQQWRLPRRVLQSLRRLQPIWNAEALSPNPPRFPFAGRRESFSRKAGRLSLSASPITEALCTECYVKNMGAAAPKRSQRFPRLGSKHLRKIELHSTKKCLEVQLEACPTIVKHSWKLTSSVCGPTLPKLLPPGRKALQPRKGSLPLVSQEDMGRIEVAVRVCHLMPLWGLATRYVEGLHAMIPRTPIHSLGRCRRTGLEFSEGQVLFLDGGTREALESHVRKKRLQHEWGLPVLVRSSVQAFAKGFPLAPAFLRTKADVETLQQDSAFLPQQTRTHLEHHLQRQKLQQQWGLPLRVLKSLHMLMPETGTGPVDRTLTPPTRTFSTDFSSRLCKRCLVEGATDRAQDTEEAPKMVGRAPCRACQGSTLKGAAWEKMQRHLAKRSVEIHLEAFPAIPRLSWRLALLSVKHPLPKLIPPGQRDLEPRRSSFPFLKSKEMGRVELALRCSRLASLWGLGMHYVEILTVMAPRPPFHPVKRPRAAFGLPEGQPPCFAGLDPETLEMHVKKKRMQHEWGLPSLALRSLGGFMQGTPTLPPLSKTVIHIDVKLQELSFLPGVSCHLLEFHVQRMKLQRTWGLPGRILASSKALMAPPLADPEWKKRKAGDRGRPEMKRARRIGRPSQATSVGLVSRQAPEQPSGAPILRLFRNSKIKALEAHLKRRSLEIKLRSLAVDAGTAKQAPLPKCAPLSPVVKRREEVLFVELDALLKVTLNIKRKYLTYLWGLPTMHSESLQKMFGSVPECPQKRGLLRREATGKGHGAISPGKWTSFGPRSISSPEVKLSFHTDESLDLLERHIRHKKLQHEWGLPFAIQKSLRAFAPFPSDVPRSAQSSKQPAWRPCCVEVSTILSSLLFLDPVTRKQLEGHVKSRTAAHRWGLPKRVQQSLKRILPPAPLSQGLGGQAPTSLCRCGETPQAITRHLQGKAEGFHSRVTSRFVPPRRVSLQESGTQQHHFRAAEYPAVLSPEEIHQGKTRRRGEETPEKMSHRATTFLTSQTRDLLEFHIQHKRIQHEWGVPSILQKSLRAFAPPPPDSRVSMKPRAGAYMAAKNLGVEGTAADHTPLFAAEVRVPFQALAFLDQEVKSCLEAHVRSRTAAHRWGLPRLVQDSLGAFHPPELCSQTHKGQSPRQQEIHSERVESPGLCRVKHRAPEQRKVCQGKRVAGRYPSTKGTAFSSPEKKAPFLTVQALGLLEFHIQSKKVQHMWGLPSAVLKSTRAFAPFPFETEKNMHHAAKVSTKTCSWVREEVQVIMPSVLFLSPETTLHLDAHLRNMVAKHQWGLPARVLQSLWGFLPPRPSSRPRSAPPLKSFQIAAVGEGSHDDSMPRWRKTANQKSIHQPEQVATPSRKVKVPSFPSPMGRLQFLTGEAQELLEFHIQSKKVQHMWGLPSAALKSTRAFAPFPFETQKDAQGAGGTLTKRHPQDTKVCISVESLVFLSPDIKEGLEAHVRSRTAEHRWGLPKLVQKSLTAFLPPASLPQPGETRQPLLHQDSESPLVPVTPCQIAPEGSVRRLPSRREASKELEKEKPTATSSVTSAMRSTTSLTAELPFLTDSKQEALEFHIQRKKIQHEWGLPVTVQKSVHAFAPVPPEPHQGGPSTVGKNRAIVGTKDTVAEMEVGTKKLWIPGIVNVTVPSLHFLDSDTKENLDAHLRHLTIEHRWGAAALVHQTMRAFIPLPSHLDITGVEDLEHPSAYSRDKTLTPSDAHSPADAAKGGSADDQHILRSELLHEVEQGWGTASSLASRQPPFGPERAVVIPEETGSWKARRESPQRSTLQTRPHLKKAAQRQRSRVFDARQVPRTPFLSSSSPGAKKYRSNVSSWSTNLPWARCSWGRISSGRTLVPRSSRTAFRDRKGRSQQVECGFQRTADSSRSRAGIEQPQAPDVSYSSWELGRVKDAYPCSCHFRAYRDSSGSSLSLDVEQRWGKAQGAEADSSKGTDLQDFGFSSSESLTDESFQKQESPSAHFTPARAYAASQHSIPTTKKAKTSLGMPSAIIQAYTLSGDPSAGPHRQAGGARQKKANSKLQKPGSRLGGDREKKKSPLHLRPHQPSVGALRRPSYGDLCEACRNLKPPPLPKGSEDRTSEAGPRPPDSGAFKQRHPPVPRNQGPLERKRDSQGCPGHDLQAKADDGVVERKGEQGALSFSKEPRPLSTGEVSQFSTEWERERVGDWDTDEEAAGGGRDSLGKRQGGSPKAAGEKPKTETSLKAQPTPKGACPPAVKQLRPSRNREVCRKKQPDLVKIERQSVLGSGSGGRRMVGRGASVVVTARVTGPEGGKSQRAKEEEDKMLHRRKEGSRKGPHPGKETLVRHGRSHPLGMPRDTERLKREALKVTQEVSKGIRERGSHTRFIHELYVKEVPVKLSLLGTIVERKLRLREGLHIWVQSQEGERGSQKGGKKSTGTSQLPTPQVARTAQVKQLERQRCGSRGVAAPRGSDRALHARPQQPQTSPNSEVCRKKQPDLVKIERQSVLGSGSGGRRMVGRGTSVVATARDTGPEGGKSQRAKEEEDMKLHRRKEGSKKGPCPGREALPGHGRSHLLGTPRDPGRLKREALKVTQEVSKGIRERGSHTRFIHELYAKQVPVKLSLLGTIVERKLYLREGLHIWVKSQKEERGSQKGAKKSAGTSSQNRDQGLNVKDGRRCRRD